MSTDGVSRLSHIIPYNQLFNEYGWTALERGMAEGVGFEPTVRKAHNGFRDRSIYCKLLLLLLYFNLLVGMLVGKTNESEIS